MRFETAWAFAILLLIPVLLYLSRRRSARPGLRFSSTNDARRTGRSLRQRLMTLPRLMRTLVLVLLIVCIARPQQGKERIRDVSKGIAIEMVVDRSSSMGAEMEFAGERLSRLDVVKRVFQEFVLGNKRGLKGRPNDLIGMVAFARYADTICPLTLGHGALARFLESVKLVTLRSEDGTAIGDALALAAARLKTAEETLARQTKDTGRQYKIKSKVIILLTDGQHNAGKRSPFEAAALAKQWGIKIYTIGIGGDEAVRKIQTPLGQYILPGGPGVDEDTLRAIADETGGVYRRATDAQSLRSIYKEIDAMEQSKIESVRFLDYRESFPPFALLALILLVGEVFLTNTVFRKIP
ncbi:MAG: VWA domain-containing protein [Planctomycetes bacterium]|nr:VWA domain-containing protein [Planctomycetota bacterium]